MEQTEPTEEQKENRAIKHEEFLQFILKHMTAEQALRKLLRTNVMVPYETAQQLKLGTALKEDEPFNPLFMVIMAAMDLGWQIALENDEDQSKHVEGITIGTEAYMERMFKGKKKDEASPDK